MDPFQEYVIDKNITPLANLDLLISGYLAPRFVLAYVNGTKQRVFLKFYTLTHKGSRDKHYQNLINSEAATLQALDHPGIVKYFDSGKGKIVPKKGKEMEIYYIALEYLPHGTLMDLMEKPFSQDMLRYILRQVAEAIAYLHSKGYVHLDIKPENIMIGPEYEVKLTGFGLTQKPAPFAKIKPIKDFYEVGPHVAPEMESDKTCDGFLADAYSFGMLALALGYKCYPYRHSLEHNQMGMYIIEGNWEAFWQEFVETAGKKAEMSKVPFANSKELQRFSTQFLELDVNKRSKVENALNDDWLMLDSLVDKEIKCICKPPMELPEIDKAEDLINRMILKKTSPLP